MQVIIFKSESCIKRVQGLPLCDWLNRNKQARRDKRMAANIQHQTAKIYAFPTRAQLAAGYRRDMSAMALEVADALRLKRTDFGSGWYHDAAIEDNAVHEKKN
jgi:hypothetical protein